MHHAERLKKWIVDYCETSQIPYEPILVTSRSAELLEWVPTAVRIPIYFLDIELKGENRKGLEIAQEIRRQDTEGLIVFVTTHAELAPISYRYLVSALSFIDKGWPEEEQAAVVRDCVRRYDKLNTSAVIRDDFVVDTEQASVRIPYSQLVYIATDGPHRLMAVTANRIVHYYGTLKEAETLDGRLLRCHQSYLVNEQQIAEYDIENRELVLETGHRVPVSRRMQRFVRQCVKRGI